MNPHCRVLGTTIVAHFAVLGLNFAIWLSQSPSSKQKIRKAKVKTISNVRIQIAAQVFD